LDRQIERTVKQGVFELYKVKNETSEAQWVVNKIQEIVSLKNRDDIEGELNFEKPQWKSGSFCSTQKYLD
jgi:hypothetical protein